MIALSLFFGVACIVGFMSHHPIIGSIAFFLWLITFILSDKEKF